MVENQIPVATPITAPGLKGANGDIYLASRVKTFYVRPGVDSGKWYYGVITEILDNNMCSIKYDEGFSVTGNADCVTVLNNNLIQAFPVITSDETGQSKNTGSQWYSRCLPSYLKNLR